MREIQLLFFFTEMFCYHDHRRRRVVQILEFGCKSFFRRSHQRHINVQCITFYKFEFGLRGKFVASGNDKAKAWTIVPGRVKYTPIIKPPFEAAALDISYYNFSSIMMSFTNIITLLGLIVTANAAVFKNGDSCGVNSSDFLNYDYLSEYLVAGEKGCSLGEDSGCFCAPDLKDGDSLSEWKWQCNNTATFGPNVSAGKVCPEAVPISKGLGDLDVVSNRRALQGMSQQSISCDTAINPTGRPGDEVCPYSSCDEGGDHSAICACIDLSKYGLGDGMEWVCMHATCGCGDEASENTEGALEESGSSLTTVTIYSMVSAAIVALLF
jgi:hypothetical protein